MQHEAVRRWRTRWQANRERLHGIESDASVTDEVERLEYLEAAIREVLSDNPRCGAPLTFSADQVAKIMAIACEVPQESGRPISYWTPREIADEAMKRKIVETISPQSVERFLKRRTDKATPESLLAQQQTRR